MRGSLMDKEVGSKLNFLLSRDARLEVASNLARIRANIADYSHRVDESGADQKVFAEDFRRTAYQDFVETLAKRNSAAEELKKAEPRRRLIVLQAPADAVVLEIANRTVGSVVREAEMQFVLVPPDVPLQAEVNVEGREIGQVSVAASRCGSSSKPSRFRNTERAPARSGFDQSGLLLARPEGRRCAPNDGSLLPPSGRSVRHAPSAARGARPADSGHGGHRRDEGRASERDLLFPVSAAGGLDGSIWEF
jgi:hypothetical protein